MRYLNNPTDGSIFTLKHRIIGLLKKIAELECQFFLWLPRCIPSFNFIQDAIVYNNMYSGDAAFGTNDISAFLIVVRIYHNYKCHLVFNNVSYMRRRSSPLLLASGLDGPFSGTRETIFHSPGAITEVCAAV